MNTDLADSYYMLTNHIEDTAVNQFNQFVKNRMVIIACLIFSIALHAAILIKFKGADAPISSQKTPGQTVNIVLTPHHSEPTQTVEKQKPVSELIEKVLPQPSPENQQKTPLITTENTNQPVVRKPLVTKNEEIIEKQLIEPETRQEPTQTTHTMVDQALLNSLKDAYLQSIAAHLDKHKYYPQSARRRYIEGDVGVSFELLADGQINNLQIHSGHSVLQRATSSSIENALPLPPRPNTLLAMGAMKVEYSMRYSLKH